MITENQDAGAVMDSIATLVYDYYFSTVREARSNTGAMMEFLINDAGNPVLNTTMENIMSFTCKCAMDGALSMGFRLAKSLGVVEISDQFVVALRVRMSPGGVVYQVIHERIPQSQSKEFADSLERVVESKWLEYL